MPRSWLAIARADGESPLEIIPGADASVPRVVARDGCTLALSGDPDAESTLDSYLRSGAESFQELRGRFAIALVDRRTRTLRVVRDLAGVHPVFHATLGDTVLVSPDAEVLARRRDAEPRLNRLVAAAYVVRASPPVAATTFEGVERLPQAGVLHVSSGRADVSRYWRPEPETEGSEPEPSRRLEDLLRRAVSRSGDGRFGIFLSGGLDSAVVACVAVSVAKERGDEPPLALSLAFPGSPLDETRIQREVAARLGIEHVIRSPGELVPRTGLLSATLELASRGGSQPPDLLTAPYLELAREAAERGCCVILGGSGGDEWLMPPPGYAADRLWALDLPALHDLIRAADAYWPDPRLFGAARSILWSEGGRPLARALIGGAASLVVPTRYGELRRARALARIPAFVAPDPGLRRGLAEMVVAATPPSRPGRLGDLQKRALLHGASLSDSQERSRDLELHAGLLVANPFLDPDLVAFLYSLEPRALVGGGRAKALAREVLERRLGAFARAWPRTVYGNSLWIDAIRREGGDVWRQSGGTPRLAAARIVDEGEIGQILAGSGRQRTLSELSAAWRALVFERWLTRAMGSIL